MRISSHICSFGALFCATLLVASALSENEEAEQPTPSKLNSKSYGGFLFRANKKSSYVKCVSDDECGLISDGLVCKANRCKKDCPGACETVTLCKTDKNCWNLGPRYECARDGICTKRPEQELQEGKMSL